MIKLPQLDAIKQWALSEDDWAEFFCLASTTVEIFAACSLGIHPNDFWQVKEFVSDHYDNHVKSQIYSEILAAYNKRLNVLGDCREIARKLSDNMESHVQPD